ncbi:MAG TPA: pilus assembly protein PilV [Ramlibacter sp.]|jgi:type IV pilus assembly protein PilV|uniref:type IV pilus modification PilV family protein n=1 Tax=Ramlibacter sp. TaxID=1917967 RepID=UPI002D6E9303|nr:pilus assembly protein PilV [Ramlibacter sp.]HZY19497.1 pilus assembly protein PilV [Ramlibacter sp.]
MIEALVGILLFCIGILGLVGLQGSMTRAQSAAKYRADAAYLGNEMVAAIWTDKANIADYATSPGTVCTAVRCADWVRKVGAALPGGSATVNVTAATGAVGITLTWSPPGEGTRSYVLSTQVQ